MGQVGTIGITDGVTIIFTPHTGAGTTDFITETLITTITEETLIDLTTIEITIEIILKEAIAIIIGQIIIVEVLTIHKNNKHIDVVTTLTHITGQTATTQQQEGLVTVVKDLHLLDQVPEPVLDQVQKETKDLTLIAIEDKHLRL